MYTLCSLGNFYLFIYLFYFCFYYCYFIFLKYFYFQMLTKIAILIPANRKLCFQDTMRVQASKQAMHGLEL